MKPSLILVAALMLMAMTACSSDDTSATPATDLSARIDSLITAGDHQTALEWIDTLNTRYADSLDLRRKAIAQRARAVEGLTIMAIPEADSLIGVYTHHVDSLGRLFTAVSVSPRLAPYYVPSAIKGQTLAIQPRVSDDDMPWMIVVNGASGTDVPLALVDASGVVVATSTASALPIVTTEQADTIGYVLAMADSQVGYKLKVGKATHPLTPAVARAIAQSWQYAKARENLRQAKINREALERRLMTARTQAATASPNTPTTLQ